MKTGRNAPCPCGSGIKYKHCCLNKSEYDFIIGNSIFKEQIEPLYNSFETKIDRLLEFEISLPFQIAIEDNSLFSFGKNEYLLHYLYKLRKHTVVIEEHKDLPVEKYYTSVVIVVGYNSNMFKENEEDANKFFDCSLEELNAQIMAYTTYTKDDRCFRVTKEMLFPIVIMNLVNLEERKSKKQLFLLHMDVPYKKDNIKRENVGECLRLYHIYNEKLNPFIHSESYVLKARRKFREGFYDDAIISIQTNIEILIRIVYKEVLICSGICEPDIEKKLEDESFMSIVKKELSKYIGGIWDVTREGTPIKFWYDNTYKMRNKIVHGGYYPTFEETDLAIHAAMEFRDFIFQRIRTKKNTYSKLNEYFS